MVHDFVDPDAGDKWIVLSDLFRIIKALSVDDRVARDGLHRHGQVLGSAMRDFPRTAVEAPVFDRFVSDRFKPLAPGRHNLWCGFFESEMQ